MRAMVLDMFTIRGEEPRWGREAWTRKVGKRRLVSRTVVKEVWVREEREDARPMPALLIIMSMWPHFLTQAVTMRLGGLGVS